MFDFTMELAGRKIAVSANFERTREYCQAYLTEGEPDFSVTVGMEELAWEHRNAKKEKQHDSFPGDRVPPPFLEQAALYRMIASRMLEYDTVLFHGSAISVDGQGYLFTALSGTGKSTHTALWRSHFGDRAVMVNDDKPLLRVTKGGVFVCGTPWNGKHNLGCNISVPLKGICVLNRGTENTIRTLTPSEAIPYLLQQSYIPPESAAAAKVMSLLGAITSCTGLYSLHCNMNPEAAVVAYNGMNGKEN